MVVVTWWWWKWNDLKPKISRVIEWLGSGRREN
jgi:hypothetical protein